MKAPFLEEVGIPLAVRNAPWLVTVRNKSLARSAARFLLLLAFAASPLLCAGTCAAQTSRPVASETLLLNQCKQRWAALGFATKMVRVNGVTLHVAEAGHGSPVLLLHGYPQSGEAWRFVAPRLSQSHRVIIPDLRGMGLSEAAKGGYDLSNVAEDIHQLMLSMHVTSVMIVGHDWGGAVGAVYALRYPHEVTRLAFIESALAGAGFETLWDFRKPNPGFTFVPFLLMGQSDPDGDTTSSLLKDREAVFLHHLWATFTGDKAAAPFAEWSPYILAMKRPGIATASSTYYRSVYQSADEVRLLVSNKLTIPVLAIAGEKGIGKQHATLARAFTTNLVGDIILPGAGHFLPEERPAEVVSNLQTFLVD